MLVLVIMIAPTWQYVAGFFDGEGHITNLTSYARPSVLITQADRNDVVLSKISEFLSSKGVHHLLRPKSKATDKWLATSTIAIHSWRDVRRFLRTVLPYLIVKRVRAIEALDFIENREWRAKTSPEQLEGARVLYHQGLSFRDAAHKFKLESHQLRNYMRKQGEAGRTQSEAVTLWHKHQRSK